MGAPEFPHFRATLIHAPRADCQDRISRRRHAAALSGLTRLMRTCSLDSSMAPELTAMSHVEPEVDALAEWAGKLDVAGVLTSRRQHLSSLSACALSSSSVAKFAFRASCGRDRPAMFRSFESAATPPEGSAPPSRDAAQVPACTERINACRRPANSDLYSLNLAANLMRSHRDHRRAQPPVSLT